MPELINTSLYSSANLKAYWRLESGAFLTDTKGSYTLTNSNSVSSVTTGKYGGCADFGTASENNKALLNSSAIVTGSNFSMGGWVKLRTEISSNDWRFFRWGYGSTPGLQVLYEYNGGTRRIAVRTGGNDYRYNVTLGTSNWYHVFMTRNSSNGYLYLNGSLVASGANGSTALSPNNTIIGNANDLTAGSPAYFDDVSVWDITLTEAQIKSLYQSSGSAFFMVF